MTFYRYEDKQFAGSEDSMLPGPVQIYLSKFFLIRETPKGWHIGTSSPAIMKELGSSETHWVSKTAKKRHAYPTKEEAWISFQARKTRQLTIHEQIVRRVQRVLALPQPND